MEPRSRSWGCCCLTAGTQEQSWGVQQVSGGAGSVYSFIFNIAVTPAVWKPVAAGLRWYQIRRASPHLMLLEHQFLYFTGELRRML